MRALTSLFFYTPVLSQPRRCSTFLVFFLHIIFLRTSDFFGSQLDGRVNRASASEAVDSCLIPSRVKPMTLKLVFTASRLTLSIKRTAWRTSRKVYLLCRWERHSVGFPHLGMVDRSPATPNEARYSDLTVFRDRKIIKYAVYT